MKSDVKSDIELKFTFSSSQTAFPLHSSCLASVSPFPVSLLLPAPKSPLVSSSLRREISVGTPDEGCSALLACYRDPSGKNDHDAGAQRRGGSKKHAIRRG